MVPFGVNFKFHHNRIVASTERTFAYSLRMLHITHHITLLFQASNPGRGRAAPQGARLQLLRLPQHEAQF